MRSLGLICTPGAAMLVYRRVVLQTSLQPTQCAATLKARLREARARSWEALFDASLVGGCILGDYLVLQPLGRIASLFVGRIMPSRNGSIISGIIVVHPIIIFVFLAFGAVFLWSLSFIRSWWSVYLCIAAVLIAAIVLRTAERDGDAISDFLICSLPAEDREGGTHRSNSDRPEDKKP